MSRSLFALRYTTSIFHWRYRYHKEGCLQYLYFGIIASNVSVSSFQATIYHVTVNDSLSTRWLAASPMTILFLASWHDKNELHDAHTATSICVCVCVWRRKEICFTFWSLALPWLQTVASWRHFSNLVFPSVSLTVVRDVDFLMHHPIQTSAQFRCLPNNFGRLKIICRKGSSMMDFEGLSYINKNLPIKDS